MANLASELLLQVHTVTGEHCVPASVTLSELKLVSATNWLSDPGQAIHDSSSLQRVSNNCLFLVWQGCCWTPLSHNV